MNPVAMESEEEKQRKPHNTHLHTLKRGAAIGMVISIRYTALQANNSVRNVSAINPGCCMIKPVGSHIAL